MPRFSMAWLVAVACFFTLSFFSLIGQSQPVNGKIVKSPTTQQPQQPQPYDPNHPPNTYRSKSNPLYWKNKMPHPGYWQQDVSYRIEASLDDVSDVISGAEELIYFNNSPDTLREVYFHLYQNAFGPAAYYADINKANKVKPKYGAYEAQNQGTVVSNLRQLGAEVVVTLDNTILHVKLAEPIAPGDQTTFTMDFKTYFDLGSNRRRMKLFTAWGYKHYDAVHWYPRISVYDRKFGWTADQHLTKEFYGDFGTYDVSLTLPKPYVVEATGTLQNFDEVYPDSLRQQLDIQNFFSKPWNSQPSVITPADGTTKTWRFYGSNIHDFAWTADPTYRIGEVKMGKTTIVSLVQEPHASGWYNAASYTAQVMRVYAKDFGAYEYPKMVVADARDGMEYPMLTLDGGQDPSYRGLLAHEVGHNWFFGMVGNNETYRAMLDEGFTQFLTAWSQLKIEGDSLGWMQGRGWLNKRYFKSPRVVDDEVYWGYYRDAISGEQGTLNTHSDHFNGALGHGGGYGQVYYKTATMLFHLQYVLGDSLFQAAMRHYLAQWKIAHPYVEDFRNSIIQFTHVDLNWFFDQWIETKKTVDYKLLSVKRDKQGYRIRMRRVGEMESPIDLVATTESGQKIKYTIPNRLFTKAEGTPLSKWYGWGVIGKEYTARLPITEKLKNIEIDPSYRLPDIRPFDNRWKGNVDWKLESHTPSFPNRYKYVVRARPDIWYNAVDGVKAGLHLNGDYFEMRRFVNFSAWYNTGLGVPTLIGETPIEDTRDLRTLLSYRFTYRSVIPKISSKTEGSVDFRYLDGLERYKFSLTQELTPRSKAFVNLVYQYRRGSGVNAAPISYLINPDGWTLDAINATGQAGLTHNYTTKKGSGQWTLSLRSSLPFSDNFFTQVRGEWQNTQRIFGARLRSRVFAQLMTGNPPNESRLYAAGGSPEEMMDTKYYRAAIYRPNLDPAFGTTTQPLHFGGGLNLRGYNGYVLPEIVENGLLLGYSGLSGAAVNLEYSFSDWFKFSPKITRNWLSVRTYLFGDAGGITVSQPGRELSNWQYVAPRADAGAGVAFTIKRFFRFTRVQPLTLRADFPIYLSDAPFSDTDNIQFRYVVGIGMAF
jgi:aminopeptidase N